jgi:hypothetical protein
MMAIIFRFICSFWCHSIALKWIVRIWQLRGGFFLQKDFTENVLLLGMFYQMVIWMNRIFLKVLKFWVKILIIWPFHIDRVSSKKPLKFLLQILLNSKNVEASTDALNKTNVQIHEIFLTWSYKVPYKMAHSADIQEKDCS